VEALPLLLPCRRRVLLEGFELETKVLRAVIDDDLIGGCRRSDGAPLVEYDGAQPEFCAHLFAEPFA
jgi:hypothetical protein